MTYKEALLRIGYEDISRLECELLALQTLLENHKKEDSKLEELERWVNSNYVYDDELIKPTDLLEKLKILKS